MYVDKHQLEAVLMENMEKEAIDFLIFSLVGIRKEDIKDFELLKFTCINRAFQDASRRVLHTTNSDGFRKEGITYLMSNIKKDKVKPASMLIEELYNHLSNKIDGVTYGIAQKWVNMTYKYLCVLCIMQTEQYTDFISEIHNLYDVPIDSTMICMCKEAKNKAWSIYEKQDYDLVKKELLLLAGNNDLFVWENDNWIANRIENKDSIKRKYKSYTNELQNTN